MDEADQCERLGGGVIDRDLVRRTELLQHQHVGVREHQVKAFRHQDRQRSSHPELDVVRLGAGLDPVTQPAVKHEELPERGHPDAQTGERHRGYGVEGQADQPGGRHRDREQQLARDIGGHDAEPDPVIGARDAVLRVGERIGRQRDAGEIKRDHGVVVEPGLQQPHQAGTGGGGRDRNADGEPAAAGDIAAQEVIELALAIFRDEALRSGREPEIERLTEQQHPGPDIDVDAELEASHPACEQDLRSVGEHRAGDADQEHRAGEPLHHQAIGVAGPRREPQPEPPCPRARRQARCLFGAGQCQTSLPGAGAAARAGVSGLAH